jgi:hypothetical protein
MYTFATIAGSWRSRRKRHAGGTIDGQWMFSYRLLRLADVANLP